MSRQSLIPIAGIVARPVDTADVPSGVIHIGIYMFAGCSGEILMISSINSTAFQTRLAYDTAISATLLTIKPFLFKNSLQFTMEAMSDVRQFLDVFPHKV